METERKMENNDYEMELTELQEFAVEYQGDYEEMMNLYNRIKKNLAIIAPSEYERWKSGGCKIDIEFQSTSPTLGEVLGYE